MKLFIPQSIFAGIAIYNLDESTLSNVEYRPAANIVNELIEGKCDAAFLPSFDLLRHEDLLISKNSGISFDGALCNSFLYFQKDIIKMNELFLCGDVTSNEIFMSKILFEELYNVDVKITLETKKPKYNDHNYLIVGNSNFEKDLFKNGISFAEQLSEFIDYPYVNFVLASKKEDVLKELNSQLKNNDEKIEEKINSILFRLNLTDDARKYITKNFNQVYFEMTENEIVGLGEMLKFPYYKGITKEMIDLNLV